MSLDRAKIDLSGRTPIGKGPEAARWPGFADDLTRQIEAGVLEPGDEVSVKPQMEEWGCSSNVAAKTLDHLANRGLLLRPPKPGLPYKVAGDDSWMR